jgi:uncharacterized Zn finger protein
MDITRSFVSSFAPDSGSVSDGDSLVRKGKFVKLLKDKDNTIIFGECSGSGKNPYSVSVDFINPEVPIPRCSCPSRKIPCKHAIGIMLAYVDGKAFTEAEIPEDVLSKRGKIQKKEEKAKAVADGTAEPAKAKAPKKASPAAVAKKIQAQLDGLGIADTLISTIVRDGFGAATAKTCAEIEKQAKQMGDHYLPGVQKELLDLVSILDDDDRESAYTKAYEQITRTYALIKKGKDYLAQKLANPDMARDITSEIEALLGHPWKLTELEEVGLVENNASLVQLAFAVNHNDAVKQIEEIGVWISLSDGFIGEAKNIIPLKAAKYIANTDSIQGVLCTSALCKYPGTINRRIRWEGYTLRDITAEDYKKIVSFAAPEFAPLLKYLKDQLKNPLTDKAPFALVQYKQIGWLDGELVIEDKAGQRIMLQNAGEEGWLDTISVLGMIGNSANKYSAALLRLQYIPDTGELVAAPLTLVNEKEMVKLGF